MRSGRPPAGGGAAIQTVRVRARQPRAAAVRAAAEAMAGAEHDSAAGPLPEGARVFTLYGGTAAASSRPSADTAAPAVEPQSCVLDFYSARQT